MMKTFSLLPRKTAHPPLVGKTARTCTSITVLFIAQTVRGRRGKTSYALHSPHKTCRREPKSLRCPSARAGISTARHKERCAAPSVTPAKASYLSTRKIGVRNRPRVLKKESKSLDIFDVLAVKGSFHGNLVHEERIRFSIGFLQPARFDRNTCLWSCRLFNVKRSAAGFPPFRSAGEQSPKNAELFRARSLSAGN